MMNILTHRRFLFLIFGILFSLSILIILILLISSELKEYIPDSDYVIPTYSANAINEICLSLNIDSTDEFCANHSNQNLKSFELMLQRNYPIKETTYTQLMNMLNIFKSLPSSYCKRVEVEGYGIYALNNCPPPDQCGRGYTCTFDLTENIGVLQVNISYPDGSITGYQVLR